jgi:hypothetical protein
MVKSQLLDGSASGIGNRKAQSQMQLHDTRLFETADQSVVDAALIVEKSRFSPVNRRSVETERNALEVFKLNTSRRPRHCIRTAQSFSSMRGLMLMTRASKKSPASGSSK